MLYRQLLEVDPNNADALHLLGLVVHQSGSAGQAVELIGKAILLNPSAAYFHNNLGNVLQDQGSFGEAVAAYRRAIELTPDFAVAHNNLGNALKAQGKLEEAVTAYEQALRLDPNLAETWSNLANTWQQQGQSTKAIAAFRRAIALKPDYAMAHNNLGTALLANRQVDEAVAEFRQALALQPNLALAHNNLGTAWKEHGRMDEAIAAYRDALGAEPNFVLALSNLANALNDRGELHESIPLYERAIHSAHCPPGIHSNYLVALHYSSQSTPRLLSEAHAAYDRSHALPFRGSSQPRPAEIHGPHRPIRLGFISSHFHFHPVGHFLVRLLENLDRREFAAVCYSDRSRPDAMTARLQACVAAWHQVESLSDEQLTQRIRDDQIDILFDLAGHTAGNRLLVFARKPAPIQITWLDYVGTTGLSAIDYILADPRQIPPEAEPFYREKVLRLPHDYICFDPPAAAPVVGPLPATKNGYVTFGSFNIAPKTTFAIVQVWSRILREISDARLILKNRAFSEPSVSARIRCWFGEESIDSDRILFEGWSPQAELLAAYHQVDIALDTFPYNGGLTTCEALWMGVPVVTCPGETFASRHGLAHLTAGGFTETIARDLDDYVDIAVALATDIPRLSALRTALRPRIAKSPLCDGPRFAKDFESLMREVWRRWCEDE